MRRPACFSMHTVLQDKAVPPHSFPISYIMEETNSTKQKKKQAKKTTKKQNKKQQTPPSPLVPFVFFCMCPHVCVFSWSLQFMCVFFFLFFSSMGLSKPFCGYSFHFFVFPLTLCGTGGEMINFFPQFLLFSVDLSIFLIFQNFFD
jgi:hypothetical protein